MKAFGPSSADLAERPLPPHLPLAFLAPAPPSKTRWLHGAPHGSPGEGRATFLPLIAIKYGGGSKTGHPG